MVGQWPYSVSITDTTTNTTRSFPIDTSFEPYRREAFRHKTIRPLRESVMMTNIVGEGTVNTEGLWRREQVNWEQGAGQYALDKKGDAISTRFYSSKGIDVFSYPYQATLLADTLRVDSIASPGNNLNVVRCGDYVVVVNGATLSYYTPNTTGTAVTLTSCTFNASLYGGVAPTTIRSIDANDAYCFAATDTGIWFSNIGRTNSFTGTTTSGSKNVTSVTTTGLFVGMPVSGTNIATGTTIASIGTGTITLSNNATASGSTTITTPYITAYNEFRLYAGSDQTAYYGGGYDLVRIANDQLIASRGNRLYAFQPRSASVAPTFGTSPSTSIANSTIVSAYDDGTGTNTWIVNTSGAHNMTVGQQFTVSAPQMGYTSYYNGTGNDPMYSTGGTVTFAFSSVVSGVYYDAPNSTVSVGDSVQVALTETRSSGSPFTIYDTGTVTAVGSTQNSSTSNPLYLPSTHTFPAAINYVTNNVTMSNTILDVLGTSWLALITDTTNSYAGLSSTYSVKAVNSSTQFTVSDSSLLPYQCATGGTIVPSTTTDVLMTHQNPSWIWSDAVGGATQAYFSGYVNGASGKGRGGAIYKSGMIGSSTTSVTNVQANSNTSVFQPFVLNYPTQALPMSPDEYPTCLASYLNFIFIGTNRGIRMAQTLSTYDPTATSTGDLKSGPIIPDWIQSNIPDAYMPGMNYPVTGIIGDGRFIWFTWNGYDSTSTGLGKLDLTQFIGGDPMTPAFASDIMVSYNGTYNTSTGQGIINNLSWDPARNVPVFAIGGKGIYTANAVNNTGLWTVTKYVSSGVLNTPVFDYGIPEQKVPVFFDFGVSNYSGSSVSAFINPDPDLPAYSGTASGTNVISSLNFTYGLTVGAYVAVSSGTPTIPANTTITAFDPVALTVTLSNPVSGSGSVSFYTYVTTPTISTSGLIETTVVQARGNQFLVGITFNAGASQTTSPALHRWTLKAWPAVVQGTNIMSVFQLFSVAVVDGGETFVDPYDNFIWLENLRQNQTIVTYQEGPLSVSAIVEELDWLPHKRRDNYENGFEGDCVVTLKTLAPYTYSNVATS